MKKFSIHERRISANLDKTRFLVRYKEGEKIKVKTLRNIEEARIFRDSTDSDRVKILAKQLEGSKLNNKIDKHESAIKALDILENLYQ